MKQGERRSPAGQGWGESTPDCVGDPACTVCHDCRVTSDVLTIPSGLLNHRAGLRAASTIAREGAPSPQSLCLDQPCAVVGPTPTTPDRRGTRRSWTPAFTRDVALPSLNQICFVDPLHDERLVEVFDSALVYRCLDSPKRASEARPLVELKNELAAVAHHDRRSEADPF